MNIIQTTWNGYHGAWSFPLRIPISRAVEQCGTSIPFNACTPAHFVEYISENGTYDGAPATRVIGRYNGLERVVAMVSR